MAAQVFQHNNPWELLSPAGAPIPLVPLSVICGRGIKANGIQYFSSPNIFPTSNCFLLRGFPQLSVFNCSLATRFLSMHLHGISLMARMLCA